MITQQKKMLLSSSKNINTILIQRVLSNDKSWDMRTSMDKVNNDNSYHNT